MATEPSDDPGPGPLPHTRQGFSAWRLLGTPLALLVCGSLVVVSAIDSDGTDLRPGRYTDLATFAEHEAEDLTALQDRARELTAEVEALRGDVNDQRVRRLEREADRFRAPAGLSPTSGPGVRIVMSDASASKVEAAVDDPELNIDWFVVHQQDLQAVVNTLWAGGATAITLQGQRIISTTGIRCAGPTVQLHGVPYPQPYVIEAIGDPATLTESVYADPDVAAFRADATDESIGIGFDFTVEDRLDAPAYDGLLDITLAEPLT